MDTNNYYPSAIKLEVFPNKIYMLTWQQHGTSRQKLMRKGEAFRLANDMNVDKRLRDEVVAAFKAGVIL